MSVETDNMELELVEYKAQLSIMRDNIQAKNDLIKEQEDVILLLLDTLRKVGDIIDVAKHMVDLGLSR